MNYPMMHPTGHTDDHPDTARSPFDALRRSHPNGTEFWTARDLMTLMGYSQWSKLKNPLDRAMATARNQGLDVDANFARSGKKASSRGPVQEDYNLSRVAAYLLAMNGDPNKPEIAAAQAYFAVRTREAETTPAPVPLAPDTPEGHLALAQQYVRVAEQLVHADRRVRELEPKAAVHDRFLTADGGLRLVRQAAKELGWKESHLRGFLLAERLIYQRRSPCGNVEYDFYAAHADHFATTETLVRHNRRPGDCTHYTLHVRPAGLALIQARIDRQHARTAAVPLGPGWNPL